MGQDADNAADPTADPADELVAGALAAERETLGRECRLDADRLDAFLAPDFREFGASGAVLVKDGTARRVAEHTATGGPELVWHELTGVAVGDDVVLVTYVLAAGDRWTNRSSLWRRTTAGDWEMFFHQGTPTHPLEG